MLKKYNVIFLGQSNPATLLLTGSCTSWNGKVCTSNDTVDVGRGEGSCNSNLDCPCCAPFCSSAGYCQTNNFQTTIGINDILFEIDFFIMLHFCELRHIYYSSTYFQEFVLSQSTKAIAPKT